MAFYTPLQEISFTLEEIVFLQNLAEAADNDASLVLLGLESPSTGTVNGVNTTFTFVHSPKALLSDRMISIPTFGFTVTGSGPYTVEMDSLIPPRDFLRSIY